MRIPFGKIATLVGLGAAAGVVAFAIMKEPAAVGPGARRGGPSGDVPVPVLAGEAKLADMAVNLEGVGTAKALNTVTVRPQVDGKLIAITFREGQSVKRGDVLARIDATTFQAQLDQAVAKKALDMAQLNNAKRDMERYASVSINNVRAIFNYTDVRAPIDGRTGLRLVDEGNLVRASDTPVVVLTQVQPISVVFTLPQQQLAQVNRAMAQGPVPVEALDFDNKTVLDTGVVQVVDNQVEQTTGTVRMKADFPNANLQLWPGQFANVRLRTDTLKQVVVIPTPALQRGPSGPFVYVVQADDRVTVKPVTVALQTEQTAVVSSGVTAGERLVTSGFSKLKEGSRVLIGDPAGGPTYAPAPGAAPGSAGPAGERKRGPRPPDAGDQPGDAPRGPRGEASRGDGRPGEFKRGDGKRGEGRRSESRAGDGTPELVPKAEIDTPSRTVR